MSLRIKFIGHSCFLIEKENINLLFDPFITGNPVATIKKDDLKANYILVSHAHNDHLGDAIEIALKQSSKIISTFEICILAQDKGVESIPGHIGGKINTEFGFVKFTPAFHGSGIEGGHASGFLVDFFGIKIYFAGDTGLFGDMKLLEAEKIDLAFLPIGDTFTMGPKDAVAAVEFIKPRIVIPMHYNTMPSITQHPEDFKEAVERKTQALVYIVSPGLDVKI